MTLFLINFALWLSINHIQENWDEYTNIGKKCIYPFWFIRSFCIWIVSPLFIPVWIFTKSQLYKRYITIGDSISPDMITEFNKTNTKQFLFKKKRKKRK